MYVAASIVMPLYSAATVTSLFQVFATITAKQLSQRTRVAPLMHHRPPEDDPRRPGFAADRLL